MINPLHFATQRYSFVLTKSGTTGFTNGLNSAILRYASSPHADPTTTSTFSLILLIRLTTPDVPLRSTF
ncbi:hypothetical protein JOM56_012348 [Amanita muscaria]